MNTKPCEHCKGTGRRPVPAWETFYDELRAAGVWTRLDGHIYEGRPEESTFGVMVCFATSGVPLTLTFGDVLDDEAAQAERIARFRDILAQAGGYDALVKCGQHVELTLGMVRSLADCDEVIAKARGLR